MITNPIDNPSNQIALGLNIKGWKFSLFTLNKALVKKNPCLIMFRQDRINMVTKILFNINNIIIFLLLLYSLYLSLGHQKLS